MRRGPAPAGVSATPSLEHERALWQRGYARLAGVDEAGRGALAGPLVAAAVVLPARPTIQDELRGLRDSKLLTPGARSALCRRVQSIAMEVGIAVVPAALVDAAGLGAAGQLALSRAVASLACGPDFLLVDAFRLRETALPQLALVHGDARCLSIAAASVVAKVTRDALMSELHTSYPQYAFDQHKGYPTAAHRAALAALGPCPEHRRSYGPVRERCAS